MNVLGLLMAIKFFFIIKKYFFFIFNIYRENIHKPLIILKKALKYINKIKVNLANKGFKIKK